MPQSDLGIAPSDLEECQGLFVSESRDPADLVFCWDDAGDTWCARDLSDNATVAMYNRTTGAWDVM